MGRKKKKEVEDDIKRLEPKYPNQKLNLTLEK